jgi:signal transduction histidine kinase
VTREPLDDRPWRVGLSDTVHAAARSQKPTMSQVLWDKRQPPTVDLASAEWEWELCAPIDLTVSRGELRDHLKHRALPAGTDREHVDRLLLAFEELASNGLRHGRSPVHVRVVPMSDGWLIDVTDTALEHPPVPAVDRDPAQGGLGLYLVAQLCAAHGWIVRGGRKHVWACVRPTLP